MNGLYLSLAIRPLGVAYQAMQNSSTWRPSMNPVPQALVPWAMVFIIIGIHIQYCTSCFIFVNFVPGLILLYIDSHPPGRFAAICVWLLPVWLMRCCGLLCLWLYSEPYTGASGVRYESASRCVKLWPAVPETQSLPCGLWSMLSVVNRDGFRRLSKVNQWESKSYWCSAVLLFMEA